MENKQKQIKAETNYMGMNIKIYSDFSMEIKEKDFEKVKKFDADFMSSMVSKYKDVYRVYKPIPLLFWTDVKNGKLSNWQVSETIEEKIFHSLKKQANYKDK